MTATALGISAHAESCKVKEMENNLDTATTEFDVTLTQSVDGNIPSSAFNSAAKDANNMCLSNPKLQSQTDQIKGKACGPKLPRLKAASAPEMYLGEKDEDNHGNDNDEYDDNFDEEKQLQHANTMPTFPLNREKSALPTVITEKRQNSFLDKEVIPHDQFGEIRPSTSKRRSSVTIKNLAKEAEADLQHSWLLDEQTKEQWRKFEERKRLLTIVVSDEDPMSDIEQRLEEVKMMSKPRKDMRYVLDRLPADMKDKITVSIVFMHPDNVSY